MMTSMPLYPNWFGQLAQWTQGEDWRVALAHTRPSHTIIYVKRGQGRALMSGTRHGFGPNTFMSIPRDTLFSVELGRQSLAFVLSVDEPEPAAFPKTPRLLRLRDVAAIGEAFAIFDAGIREIDQARPYMHEALSAHASLLATWLRRQIFRDEHALPPQGSATRLTARFFEAAAKSKPGLLGLGELAKTLEVTPTHLSRSCKLATGNTASEVLNERVMHEAQQLLTSGSLPIQDIARHLGFGTSAYFTRFVRSRSGQSPSQMRRSSKGNKA